MCTGKIMAQWHSATGALWHALPRSRPQIPILNFKSFQRSASWSACVAPTGSHLKLGSAGTADSVPSIIEPLSLIKLVQRSCRIGWARRRSICSLCANANDCPYQSVSTFSSDSSSNASMRRESLRDVRRQWRMLGCALKPASLPQYSAANHRHTVSAFLKRLGWRYTRICSSEVVLSLYILLRNFHAIRT
jgi:hypothetical protein